MASTDEKQDALALRGARIEIRQDFRAADPDRIAMEMVRGLEAIQREGLERMDTGQLRPSFPPRVSPPRGTAQDMVDACVDVRPAGVRLVGIVVQGRVLPWRWRWVEPVALWLLRRAGFEVCQ